MSDLPERATPAASPRKSLLNDPDAEICTQFAVFRHPIFRKLKYFCYLGIPAIFLVSLLSGGMLPALLAAGASAVFLLLVIALLFVAEQHARGAAAVRAADRLRRGWQFVCPGCLQAGAVRHACGACKKELEPFVTLTWGWYLNDCAYCHARVFARAWGRGNRPNALCLACGHLTDTRHHQRRVRVVAALHATDLERLCAEVQGSMERGGDVRYFFRDTGDTMVYAVDLNALDGDGLPEFHAGRQVSAVWLDAALDEPLWLGEALDRLIRTVDLNEGRRREAVLCTPRAELSGAVRNVLEGRFVRIECGISPSVFFFER